MPRVVPRMTGNARELRRGATPEERVLWQRLRDHRPRWTRQLPVGSYILDFACHSARLAIELDGSQHLGAAAYDANRTSFLEALGWRVIRFWNSDVRDNPDGVAEAILAELAACTRPTHPQPLPSREGSS